MKLFILKNLAGSAVVRVLALLLATFTVRQFSAQAQEPKPVDKAVPAVQPRSTKPSLPNGPALAAWPKIVNSELVWGNQQIPMKRGPVMPGAAATLQKLQAALPSLLRPKFAGPAQGSQTPTLRKARSGYNLQGINLILQAYKQQTAGQPRPRTGGGSGNGGGTLKGGTVTCLECATWLNGSIGRNGTRGPMPLFLSLLNENRAARINAILAANPPAPWQSPVPMAQASYNPNNVLVDLLAGDPSAWAFSGQFMGQFMGVINPLTGISYPPCSTSLGANPYVTSATSPFPTPAPLLMGPPPLIPSICPPVDPSLKFGQSAPIPTYLPVSSPNISITVPTHIVFVGNGTYAPEAIMAYEIHLQLLQTDNNGNPIQDLSDPLGLKFEDYPGIAVQTPQQSAQNQYSGFCGSPGIVRAVCPPGEPFNPTNPIATWIVDSTADSEISQGLQSPGSPFAQTCQEVNAAWTQVDQQDSALNAPPPQPFGTGWDATFPSISTNGFSVTVGETQNCGVGGGGPPIAYPDYEAGTNTAPDDDVTFNLQLSNQLTVVRFLIEYQGSNFWYSSALIPIVVQPAGSVTPVLQPLAIVYMPPGNQSSAKYAVSQMQGVAITTLFQLQSSTTQANTNSQSWQLGGNIPLQSAGLGPVAVSASYSENSSSTNTNGQGQTSSAAMGPSFSATLTDTFAVGPPGPGGPTVVTWQPNTPYCQNGEHDLVQANPPDGNAYLCVPNPSSTSPTAPADCTSGPGQPVFNPVAAVEDGTPSNPECWWMDVGSAAVFESPFWSDLFDMAVDPEIYLWDFAGTPSPGTIQAMPVTGTQGLLQVSAFELHLCAEGIAPLIDAGSNITLTPYECASLLTLDPFYMNGQHTSRPSWVTVGQGSISQQAGSITIQNVTTAAVTLALSTGTSSTAQISSTSGSTATLGIPPIASGTAGPSQSSSAGITFSLLTSPTQTQSASTTISATLQTSGGASVPIQAGALWVDNRFGTVMFPSVTPSGSISLSGGGGCEVVIAGSGLTGTTNVNFDSFPAVFTIPGDNQIDVWVPAVTGIPASVPVTIQVEGVSQPIPVGTFTLAPSPCTG
jgi:hypothetical protein